MKKLPRSTVVPAILFIYLMVMAYIGLDGLKSGETSVTVYLSALCVTLVIIVALHFVLKKRERLRNERLKDIDNSSKNNK